MTAFDLREWAISQAFPMFLFWMAFCAIRKILEMKEKMIMKSLLPQKSAATAASLLLIFWMSFLVIGWVLNLNQTLGMAPEKIVDATTMFIVKATGIVAVPFGALMGWIGLFS